MIRILLIFAGTVSLILGVIGIFVPGLPTTPFLLLTTSLYIRSSPKLNQLVLSNKFLGPYILQYRQNKGMTLQQKFSSIGLMWFMTIISTVFFIQSTPIRLVVIGASVVGTLVMGFIVPISKGQNTKKKL